MSLPQSGVQLVAEGYGEYRATLSKAQADLDHYASAMSGATHTVSAGSQIQIGALRQVGAAITETFVNLAGSAISSIGGLISKGTGLVAAYEMQQKSLTALAAKELMQTGAAKDMADAMKQAGPIAQENLKWLEQLAVLSPYSAEDIQNSLRLAQSLGFTSAQTKVLVQNTVDWATATGQSGEVINRVTMALGQMNTKGKTSGEEMLQLTEAGVPAWEYLSKAIGKSTAETQAMVTKGLIPANVAIQAVSDGMKNDFGGAAKEASGTLSGLANSAKDLGDQALRAIMTPALDALKPVLSTVVDLLGSEGLKTAIESAGQAIGATIGPIAEFVATTLKAPDPLGAIVARLNDLIPGVGPAVSGFQDLAGAIDLAVFAAGNMDSATASVAAFFEVLTAGDVGSLTDAGDMLAGTFASLGTVIADAGPQISGALTDIIGNVQQMQDATLGVFAAISDGIDAAMTIINATITQHGSDMLSAFLTSVTAIHDTATEIFTAVLAIVQTVFGEVATFLQANSQDISAFLAASWQQIQGIVQTATQIIQATIVPAFQAIAAFLQEHSAQIQQVLSVAWTAIKAVIDAALALIQGVLKVTLDVIRGDWSQAWTDLKEMSARIVMDIYQAISANLSLIQEVFANAGARIREIWNGLVSEARSIGSQIIAGIVAGVSNAAGSLYDRLRSLASEALAAAKDALVIHSPSRVFAEQVGEPIVVGIARGITATLDQLRSAMEQVKGELLSQFNTIASEAEKIISSGALSGLTGKKGLAEQALANYDAMQKLTGATKAWADEQYKAAEQQAKTLAQTDPEAAARQFALQSKQIKDEADLREKMQDERTARDDAETKRAQDAQLKHYQDTQAIETQFSKAQADATHTYNEGLAQAEQDRQESLAGARTQAEKDAINAQAAASIQALQARYQEELGLAATTHEDARTKIDAAYAAEEKAAGAAYAEKSKQQTDYWVNELTLMQEAHRTQMALLDAERKQSQAEQQAQLAHLQSFADSLTTAREEAKKYLASHDVGFDKSQLDWLKSEYNKTHWDKTNKEQKTEMEKEIRDLEARIKEEEPQAQAAQAVITSVGQQLAAVTALIQQFTAYLQGGPGGTTAPPATTATGGPRTNNYTYAPQYNYAPTYGGPAPNPSTDFATMQATAL